MTSGTARIAPRILVVMGVSGSGKSTVAAALARDLGWHFAEGDDFHPLANIAKMRSGQPLDDDDRMPWLDKVALWIDAQRNAAEPGIITCSALKRRYRDHLAVGRPDVLFVYLKGSADLISRHIAGRAGHFMPAALLSSQFETLEEPTADEQVIVVDAARPVPVIVTEIEAGLGVT